MQTQPLTEAIDPRRQTMFSSAAIMKRRLKLPVNSSVCEARSAKSRSCLRSRSLDFMSVMARAEHPAVPLHRFRHPEPTPVDDVGPKRETVPAPRLRGNKPHRSAWRSCLVLPWCCGAQGQPTKGSHSAQARRSNERPRSHIANGHPDRTVRSGRRLYLLLQLREPLRYLGHPMVPGRAG